MSITYQFTIMNDVEANDQLRADLLANQDIKISNCSFETLNDKKVLNIEVDGDPDLTILLPILKRKFDAMGLTIKREVKVVDKHTSLTHAEKKANKEAEKKEKTRAHIWKGAVGTTIGLAQLVFSLFAGGLPIAITYGVAGLSSLLTLYLGKETYEKAAKQLIKEGKLSTHSLYSLSTLSVILVSVASFFIPSLPTMFEAGPLIFGLKHVGEAIEQSLKRKVGAGLDAREGTAKEALLWVEELGEDWEVPSPQLKPGNIITLSKTDIEGKTATIPVDGIALEKTSLYTTMITGDFVPHDINEDKEISAGMWLAEGKDTLRMRVTKREVDSFLATVEKNLKEASKDKTRVEAITDTILKYFVPSILGFAFLSAGALSIFATPAIAIECFIAVLVSACPCALGIFIPSALKIAQQKAIELGIYFKNGKAIQDLATVDTVVFDLNGTLTTGTPSVTGFNVFSKKGSTEKKISEGDFLHLCSLLENSSNHIISKAICKFIQEKKLPYSADKKFVMTDYDDKNHSGIKAKIDGDNFVIGDINMLIQQGFKVDEKTKEQSVGKVYLVRNKEVLGSITVMDTLRSDAKDTVKALQDLGMQVHVCSGASQATVNHYAKLLGIPLEFAKGECLGAKNSHNVGMTKKQYIEKLIAEGRIPAMVGDGINDLVAIEASRCGFSMQSSASTATQSKAGVAVHNQRLASVFEAIQIARETRQNIIQSLIASLGYNTVATALSGGLLLPLGVTLPPAAGVLSTLGETVSVLMNTLRLKWKSFTANFSSSQAKEEAVGSSYNFLYESGITPPSPELTPSLALQADPSAPPTPPRAVYADGLKQGPITPPTPPRAAYAFEPIPEEVAPPTPPRAAYGLTCG